MPKAIKKKAKQKAASPEVEVTDRLSEIRESLAKRKNAVITYAAAGLALVAVLVAVRFYQMSETGKANEIAYQGYTIYYNDYQDTTKPREEQFQQALDLFLRAYEKKPSPRLLLYIANANYELKKYDEAMKALNDFTTRYGKEKDLLPLVYRKMVAIHLEQGKQDEALKALEALAASGTSVLGDYALLEAGRILDAKGEKETAQAKYRELEEKYPDSPYAEEVKNLIEKEEEPAAAAGDEGGISITTEQKQQDKPE